MVVPGLEHVTLGPRIAGIPETFDDAAERGTAWHLAFRVLMARPEFADRAARATGLDATTIGEIAAQAAAVRDWLAAQGFDRLGLELPVQSTGPLGEETNAIIDCLAEGPTGFLILDHKSGPCPDPAARFATYLPQLGTYTEMVAARWPDRPVRKIAINWMSEGRLTVMEAGALMQAAALLNAAVAPTS